MLRFKIILDTSGNTCSNRDIIYIKVNCEAECMCFTAPPFSVHSQRHTFTIYIKVSLVRIPNIRIESDKKKSPSGHS